MDRYYKERFEAQQQLMKKIAPLMEVNEIIEAVRDALRILVPTAMEVCILLLDPDAKKYTSPLQCALYERPVDCQSCKRDRPAVKKAIQNKKAVVVSQSEPVRRMDNSLVIVGPEYAMPVFVEGKVLAAISVVIQPLTRHTRKDFFLIRDFSEVLGTIILNARGGDILIGEETKRMIQGLWPIYDLGPVILKGLKHPQSVFSLLRPLPIF